MTWPQTTILAYDVHENRDLFFKDTPDGANQIVVGKLGGQAYPMAFVGGNCSIQGFDKEGNEAFWTVRSRPHGERREAWMAAAAAPSSAWHLCSFSV